MKVIAVHFIFESNTFNPEHSDLRLFTEGGTWAVGEPAVRAWCREADSQLAGSVRVLEAAGCDVRPVFAAMCGTPAGRLSRDCFHAIRSTVAGAIRAALPADSILLHLHGAACADGEDDVEGNLLEMVRREIGFDGPLVLSLDLHANVTIRMVRLADAITAYRTMPHIDLVATGERAARMVLERRKTVRALAKMSALIPPTDSHHECGPFAEMLRQARQVEMLPGVIDVSLFPVQPWLDVEEMGSSVVITAECGVSVDNLAAKLAHSWYEQRFGWRNGLQDWGVIHRRLAEGPPAEGPWILVDTADATTGGSQGRSAEAIERLMPVRDSLPGEVLLWVVDPQACAALLAGERRVQLGSQRCWVIGDVYFAGDARYQARSQLYRGCEFSMGYTVVLATGKLRIVISSESVMGADPAFYECVGLNPRGALAVQVKSLLGWRAGYAAPAERGLMFDGPGVTSLDFARLPFTGPRRQLYPICARPNQPFETWQSNLTTKSA